MKYGLLGIALIIFFYSCKDSGRNSQIESTDTSGVYARADQYYFKQNFLRAKEIYDTILRFDPVNATYYYRRGYCKSVLLDMPGAISDFKKSIDYNYKNLDVSYFNLGVVYRLIGEYDSALVNINKSLEILPNDRKAKLEKVNILELLQKSSKE